MNNGLKKVFDKGDMVEKPGSVLVTVLFDLICMLCFLYSTRLMYKDIYQYGEMERDFVLKVAIMVIILSLISQLADRAKKPVRVFIRLLVPALGVLWMIHYLRAGGYLTNLTWLQYGFDRIIALYMDDWNNYYNMTIMPIEWRAGTGFVDGSLDFATVVLFFVFFWLAKIIKKNILISVIPGVVFIALVLVGKMPGILGIFLLLLGVVLARSKGFGRTEFLSKGRTAAGIFTWTGVLTWIKCGVIMALLFLVITTTQQERAVQTVRNYSETAKQLAADTKNKIMAKLEQLKNGPWDSLFEKLDRIFKSDTDMYADTEQLDNDAPVYANKDILEFYLSNRPRSDVYLKKFSAAVYDNGTWIRDNSIQTQSFIKSNAKVLYELTTDKLEKVYKVPFIEQAQYGIVGRIIYLTDTKAVCLPYISTYNANQEIMINGDGWFSKNVDNDRIEFSMYNWSGDYLELTAAFSAGSIGTVESWYENYVELNYLDVPKGMTYLEEICEKEIWDYFDMDSRRYIGLGDANADRLEKAMAVVRWMQANTEYSLDLPKLPKDTDPVEYFLGISRKGYCMHYASAATLLLRRMGVPARYASGYLAKKSSFGRGKWKFGEQYKIVIQDNKAHAWVEIYLDGIGWIPVEVTNSYSDIQDSLQQETTTMEPPETSTSQDVVEQTTTPSEIETEEQVTTTEADTQQSGLENDTSGEYIDTTDNEESYWPIVFVILGMPLSILAAFCICFKLPKVRSFIVKREWKLLKQSRPRKAIIIMNRRIYLRLRLLGKINNSAKDEEYEEILKKEYPSISEADFERYMEIVKAAAFAKRKMTEEEMKFCYEIYRQTWYNS